MKMLYTELLLLDIYNTEDRVLDWCICYVLSTDLHDQLIVLRIWRIRR